MKQVSGGVCAAKGFVAAGVHCGVKASSSPDKNDLALILSEKECTAAATYTLNRVKAAPLYVTMDHLENGVAWGVVANSGNANACCPMSHENAQAMCLAAAQATGRAPEDFAVASTGVIGQTINISAIQAGLPQAAAALSADGSDAAAHAIMTTDTVKKELAFSLTLGGKEVTLGAIAKGSGMIHPNMATTLNFISTDCAISAKMLQQALREIVKVTYNCLSIDGDTSTNDMVEIMASGLAGNAEITAPGPALDTFKAALYDVMANLTRMLAKDGEGASKLLECVCSGAPTKDTAIIVAKEVIGSTLFKCAMFGEDANWGRVLCAIGYAPAEFDIDKVDVALKSTAGTVTVCQNGAGVDFSEEEAAKVLAEDEIYILVDLNQGDEKATAWGCDLTYDYVKINGDYRT